MSQLAGVYTVVGSAHTQATDTSPIDRGGRWRGGEGETLSFWDIELNVTALP